MSPQEKESLRSAILTISDPRGNWEYGWQLICQLAQMEPVNFPAPFRSRSTSELIGLSATEQRLKSEASASGAEPPPRAPAAEMPIAGHAVQEANQA